MWAVLGQGKSSELALRIVAESALLLVVVIAALAVFGQAARRVHFYGDEGHYISLARYFDYFFLRGDLTHPDWGDSYWTHTQPMLARYIAGVSVWVHGRDFARLPRPFDWEQDFEANRRQGRIPSRGLLAEAREPFVLLSVGAIGLLYLLGRVLSGPLAGLATAFLATASEFAQEFLVRAVPEAPLAFFLLLAMLFAVLGMRRRQDGGLSVGWAIAVGTALGLALSAKLTAVLSVAAILFWVVFVAAESWRRQAPDVWVRSLRVWRTVRGWALAGVVAAGLFVASNPHLYPDPFGHTIHLIDARAKEARKLSRVAPDVETAFELRATLDRDIYPREPVRSPIDGLHHVLRASLVDGLPAGKHGVPIEAPLAFAGLFMLLLTGGPRPGGVRPEALVLLTMLAYFIGIGATLPFSTPRYYIPTLLLGSLLAGLGLAETVHWISKRSPVLRALLRPRFSIASGSIAPAVTKQDAVQ